MITYRTGNIFESEAEAIVNTVNTVGVMGKGIAFQSKKLFPNNYKAYKEACKRDQIRVGRMFVYRDSSTLTGDKFIINFPTKTVWQKPSEYGYIEEGLKDLENVIREHRLSSIAIPALGSGNGGLDWGKVKGMIEKFLGHLNTDIVIYEPSVSIKDELKKERVPLTDARALLLFVLFDLVRQGEHVSEFSSEKSAYFLQRFGAEHIFKLEFNPHFYGPYSGRVRHLLSMLNGSYLMGFSGMDKKPFSPLTLIGDAYTDVNTYIHSRPELLNIAEETKGFLSGFYSDFGLEILSSIDYIAYTQKVVSAGEISQHLQNWNERKRSQFSDSRHIDLAIKHLFRHERLAKDYRA